VLAFDAIWSLTYVGRIASDLLTLAGGASLISTFSGPLVNLMNSSLSAGALLQVSGAGGTSPASATLKGSLLAASNSLLTLTGGLVNVANGGAVTMADSTSPFVSITGGVHSLAANSGTSLFAVDSSSTLSLSGGLLSVDGGANVSTSGPLLTATGTFSAGGPLLAVANGIVSSTTTSPFVSFTGTPTSGALQIAGPMFDLAGTATTTETDPDALGLTVGTDRPLRHSGTLFEGTSTLLSTNQVVKLDTALLEATAPILKLMNSTLTSSVDVLNLSLKAKLSATLLPGDALVKLNASTLNVNSGSLVNVAGGSFANLRGSLVGLDNNSTLNILAGSLFTVSGGSVFKLTGGSLGVFGSTGTNTINITNNAQLCIGCSIVTNIMNFNFPVLLKNGASAGNVNVGTGFTPFAGLSMTNKVNISGPSGAVFVLDGSTSKVKLGP